MKVESKKDRGIRGILLILATYAVGIVVILTLSPFAKDSHSESANVQTVCVVPSEDSRPAMECDFDPGARYEYVGDNDRGIWITTDAYGVSGEKLYQWKVSGVWPGDK